MGHDPETRCLAFRVVEIESAQAAAVSFYEMWVMPRDSIASAIAFATSLRRTNGNVQGGHSGLSSRRKAQCHGSAHAPFVLEDVPRVANGFATCRASTSAAAPSAKMTWIPEDPPNWPDFPNGDWVKWRRSTHPSTTSKTWGRIAPSGGGRHESFPRSPYIL